MNCDICGREITGQAFKVKVEGAKLLVCNRCQRLGKPYTEDAPVPSPLTLSRKLANPRATQRRAPEFPVGMQDTDIAEDYSDRVRSQRIKLGLTQEELSKRVKEKLSFIQKIETGKMTPNSKLCRALEHELKIKLLLPRKELSDVPSAAPPAEVTLGDIMRVKGKSKPSLEA